MGVGDIVALAGFIAGALAVPAAWLAYRGPRQERKTEEFRRHFAEIQDGQVELGRAAWMHTVPEWKSGEFPLLVKPGWISDHPYDLSEIVVDGVPLAAERIWSFCSPGCVSLR